ncbi:MAG: helix-turn-helix domain-containing protein [Dissulfurispiraceae bacterium]|jgi:transcriptional regulator with XRE-family HTH domain
MDVKLLLARNVREYREKLGFSQEELAEVSGLHRTYISGIERGVRNPTISVVAVLAKALNISVSALLSKAGEK